MNLFAARMFSRYAVVLSSGSFIITSALAYRHADREDKKETQRVRTRCVNQYQRRPPYPNAHKRQFPMLEYTFLPVSNRAHGCPF